MSSHDICIPPINRRPYCKRHAAYARQPKTHLYSLCPSVCRRVKMKSDMKMKMGIHYSGNTFPCCRTAASRTLCCRTSLSISTFKAQHHSSRSSLLLALRTSIFCCPFRDGTSLTLPLPLPEIEISSSVLLSNRPAALVSKRCGSSTARSRYLSQTSKQYQPTCHEGPMNGQEDEPKDDERIPVIVTRL